jgi:hypothetical protein
MLWVDKYRPQSLGKLDFHDDLTERLMGRWDRAAWNGAVHISL